MFDADKLDSIGAIGLARAFMFAAKNNARIDNPGITHNKKNEYTKKDTARHEFLGKLQNVKNRLYTEETKKIAVERHKYMVEFFDELQKEIEGKI